MSSALQAAALSVAATAIHHPGQPWPEQGGIYLGSLPTDDPAVRRHIVLAIDPAGELVDQEWGPYGKDVPGAASLSDGRANTLAMAEASSELAQQILQLNIAGHADWHLMSADEARLAMVYAREHLDHGDWYWTSTQFSAHYAWIQNFGHGGQFSASKGLEYRARAVRSISLSA
jgi:hypothetical protein